MEEVLEKRGYKILNWIGKGAFSNCYEVSYNKYPGTSFVAKVFIRSSYETFDYALESFKREATVMLNLSCPNIVNLYDYFTFENQFIFILEYCKKGSLSQTIQKSKLPTNLILKYVRDAINAINYLHERNIAHHDIKPANFLIDDYNRLKLCDFGLSYTYSDKMTRRFGGTNSFNPPEVIKLQPYDPFKADIWALGCTIYCMATGELPFIGDTKNDTSLQIINGVYDLPKDLDPTIKVLIQKCLEYYPKDRPTAIELLPLCTVPKYNLISKTQPFIVPHIHSKMKQSNSTTARKRESSIIYFKKLLIPQPSFM